MEPAIKRCLMLGKGHKPCQRFLMPSDKSKADILEWMSVDINPATEPDVVFDLNQIEEGKHLPFPSDHFDEIHMYEVLEHYGRQGDARGFFTGMNELWRILAPKGALLGTCPGSLSVWAWGDPGHTRIISSEMLGYLDIRTYEKLGENAATDYRWMIHPRWWHVTYDETKDDHIHFCLYKRVVTEVL